MEMMKTLERIEESACRELESIMQNGGSRSKSDWDMIDKLTHTIKSVEGIMAMTDGYSQADGMSNRTYEGGSYNDGYSSRRGRSMTTGRFVSRDDGTQSFMDELSRLMDKAPNENAREMLRDVMHSQRNM